MFVFPSIPFCLPLYILFGWNQCIPESTGSGSITRNGSSLSLGGNVVVDIDVDVCVVTLMSNGYTAAALSTILIEGTTAGDGGVCVCVWGVKNNPDFFFGDGASMAQSLSVVLVAG